MHHEALPVFRYHPDPVGTGAVEELRRTCRVCREERRWLVVGPAYATEDLRDAVCARCVADGSAAERFDARFTDLSGSDTEGIPRAVVDEIERRTPGFSGWQQERWLFCCGDGAAFLGAVGWSGVAHLPDAVAALRFDVEGWGLPAEIVDDVLCSLDADGEPTAYLFRCLHCGRHQAYADMP